MPNNKEQTYDFICFAELAYEFDFSKKAETEKKIKRRLKYYKLGNYNQGRVDYIRDLRNDLYSEISLSTKSKYFSKSNSNYADLNDFNIERMELDYIKRYDKIDRKDINKILCFAIYLFYMR